MANIIEVNDTTFEQEVLKSELPVLVDFSAPWCAPCKMVDPILKELVQKEWDNKIKVVKVNADENINTVNYCGVMGLPTLLLFKAGKVVEGFRITGYKPKKVLLEEVQKHL